MSMIYEEQYQSVLEVIAGIKPLSIIEKRKAPKTFDWLALHGNVLARTARIAISSRNGAEGPEMMVGHNEGYISDYLKLLAEKGYYTREAFQIEMGSLLGYTAGEIEEFVTEIWPQIKCECSKCGGPLEGQEKVRQKLDNDAKLARTQYHAK